jgi:LysM repeat protein
MYGVTIDEIKQWNNLTDNALSIGQQIVVKKPASSATAVTPPAVTTSAKKGVHIVASKETMFSISKQYGITLQQLKDWNKLEGNDISIGQELFVAAPSAEPTREAAPVVQSTTPANTTPAPVAQSTPPTSTPSVSGDEPKKETPAASPSTAKVETPAPQTVRISESVKNSDEVLQTGLAELIEGTSGNRKYLALHRTAPVGTIMKVRNEMNNREVFVRVMGKLPDTAMTNKLVIKISKSAYDRLGAIDPRFRVEVTYYK